MRLLDRFKEPSSWAAIASIIALAGLQVDQDLWQGIAMTGASVSGLLGIVLREHGSR